MSFKEVTQSVERMEMLEERVGIRLQGLMATVADAFSDGQHRLEVNGEIYSASGASLDGNVTVQIVAQNEKGQVVGTGSKTILRDNFVGYEVFSVVIYCKGFPTRVKIVPKRI